MYNVAPVPLTDTFSVASFIAGAAQTRVLATLGTAHARRLVTQARGALGEVALADPRLYLLTYKEGVKVGL